MIRSAYEAFSEDDAIIEKRLGKDARDYSTNARTRVIEAAQNLDARKGDTVIVRMPFEEYRETLFGLTDGAGLFSKPLFAALGANKDRSFAFGYARFMNGEDDALNRLLRSASTETPLMLLDTP